MFKIFLFSTLVFSNNIFAQTKFNATGTYKLNESSERMSAELLIFQKGNHIFYEVSNMIVRLENPHFGSTHGKLELTNSTCFDIIEGDTIIFTFSDNGVNLDVKKRADNDYHFVMGFETSIDPDGFYRKVNSDNPQFNFITQKDIDDDDSEEKLTRKAEYIGGEEIMWRDIRYSLRYPHQATENVLSGTIKVKFVIDENGFITNVETIGKKIGGGLEEEAMRVVKKLKQWNPALKDGKPVKEEKTVPIKFSLQ